MNKYKTYMYIGIIILIISILGSTYAYYKYVLASININTITKGLDYYINYAKGTDITSGTLNPSTDYTGGNSVTITLNKKDNTYDIYGHIYLDITTISSALSSSNALKYVVLEGTTKISEGTLGGVSASKSYLLAVNIPLKTISTTYTVYLWFDETNSNALSAENSSVSAKVRCEATMKKINDEPYTVSILSEKIINLYNASTKNPVTNDSITYQYDTADSLMQDIGGNIRYYGKNPNNYIYFNCSDYSNQTSSTCELWRIIGVFDGKAKLIRNEILGEYSYDNRNKATGADTSSGKNDWSEARLMKLLNSGYESETGGSLYWNRKKDTCYNGSGANTTITCDFSSTGLKDSSKSIIAKNNYSLLGWDDYNLYAHQAYQHETTDGSVYTGRETSWNGKIALMYLSDYGYAADLSKCTDNMHAYSNCVAYNWLVSGISEWTLMPKSSSMAKLYRIATTGIVAYDLSAYNALAVRPVLYIYSTSRIMDGNGSQNNPYQLSIT